MDYADYFESLGYTIDRSPKGQGFIASNDKGKDILIADNLIQQTNKQYLVVMIEEALR